MEDLITSDDLKPHPDFVTSEDLAENQEPDQALPVDTAQYYTELTKETYGEEMPSVETKEELDGINEYAAAETSDTIVEGMLKQDADAIARGQIETQRVKQRAYIAAVQALRYYDSVGKEAALAIANAQTHIAKAEVNNPDRTLEDAEALRQAKVAVADNFRPLLAQARKEESNWSYWIDLSKELILGYHLVQSSKVYGGSIFSPIKNLTEASSKFYGLIADPKVSAAQFAEYLKDWRSWMQSQGYAPGQIERYYNDIFDPSLNLETIGYVADVVSFGAIAKAAKTGGLLAGTAKAVEESAPLVGKTIGKAVIKTGEIAHDIGVVAYRGVTKSKAGRLWLFGDVDEAAKNLAKSLDAAQDVHAVTKETGKHFYTHVLDSVTKDTMDLSENIARKIDVASTLGYQEVLARTLKTIQQYGDTLGSKLKPELWQDFQKSIADIIERNPVYETHNVGELLAKVDPEDLLKTKAGNLTARIRLKETYNSFDDAHSVIKTLEEAGKDMPFGVKAYAFKSNGRVFIDMDIDTQKGWGTLLGESFANSKVQGFRSMLSSVFTATSRPTRVKALDELRALDTEFLRNTYNSFLESAKSLNKADKDLLNLIADRSIETGTFFSPEYLRQREVPESVIKSYQEYRLANDVDAYFINKARVSQMNKQGVMDISFGGKPLGKGRVIRGATIDTVENSKRKIIYGNPSNPAESITNANREKIANSLNSGYVLVEPVYGPDEFTKARRVYYCLSSDSIVENPVRGFVMNYTPGGRRFFDRKNSYLKQLVLETNPDTGRKSIVGINTVATDIDAIGLGRQRDKIEEVRKLVAQGADDATVTKLIAEKKFIRAPFHNAETFKTFCSQYGIDITDIDNSLEIVKNGEIIPSYMRYTQKADDLVGIEEMTNMSHQSHFQAIDNESKIAKMKRTGKDLFTYDFGKASTVDVEDQLRYQLQDIINTGVFKDYTEFYAEDFAKHFKDVIEGANEMTPEQMLLKGRIRHTESNVDIANQAETAQKNYMAIRGIPTDFDRSLADNGTRLLQSVGLYLEDLFKIHEQTAHGLRVKWNQIDFGGALQTARTFAAHRFLGLLNPYQLYKQAAANAYVAMLEPKHSITAMRWSLPMVDALVKSDGSLIKAMEIFSKKFGDAPEEIKAAMQSLINMGCFGSSASGGFIDIGKTATSSAGKLSMKFFTYAEMENRVTAYLTAYLSRGFRGKVLTKASDIGNVRSYAQQLYMNMDQTGLARVQTTQIAKTAFQFQSFRIRWLETLFNKELTGAQRARLLIGTGILTGTTGIAGVKGTQYLSNVFSGSTDKDPVDPGVLKDFQDIFANGVPNWALQEAGVNIDVGSVFSPDLGSLSDMPENLVGFALPSVSALTGTAKTLYDASKMIYDKNYRPTSQQEFTDYLKVLAESGQIPSHISKPMLAYHLYKTGLMYNSKGTLTVETNNLLETVLIGLGFPSMNIKKVARAYAEYQYGKEAEENLYKQLKPLYTNMCRTEDPVSRALYETTMRDSEVSMKIKQKVFQRLVRETGRNVFVPQSIQLKIQQIKQEGAYGSSLLEE